MTDLGFGLVDRRSILIVLFTLGLSDLVFGYPIPIDASSALTAFIGLVLLTGFVYGGRSILRVILLAVFFVLRFPYDLFNHFNKLRNGLPGLRGIVLILAKSISYAFLEGFVRPAFIVREWKFERPDSSYEMASKKRKFGLLGIIDRAVLVSIAFAATIPSLTGNVKFLGGVGVFILILLYIFTGSFTLVLDDAIAKADLERHKQHEEMVRAASNPNVSFPRVVETKPHYGSDY